MVRPLSLLENEMTEETKPAKPERQKPIDPATVDQSELVKQQLIALGIAEADIPEGQDARKALMAKVRKMRDDKAKAQMAAEQGEFYGKKVIARVTKKGAGQISTGVNIAGMGDMTYDAGETPELDLIVAKELEERGLVEIQDATA